MSRSCGFLRLPDDRAPDLPTSITGFTDECWASPRAAGCNVACWRQRSLIDVAILELTKTPTGSSQVLNPPNRSMN
jgi:hypothetical protein